MKGMLAGLSKMIPGPEMILQLLAAEGHLDDPAHERMAERLLSGKLSQIKLFPSKLEGESEVIAGTAQHPEGQITFVVSFLKNPK